MGIHCIALAADYVPSTPGVRFTDDSLFTPHFHSQHSNEQQVGPRHFERLNERRSIVVYSSSGFAADTATLITSSRLRGLTVMLYTLPSRETFNGDSDYPEANSRWVLLQSRKWTDLRFFAYRIARAHSLLTKPAFYGHLAPMCCPTGRTMPKLNRMLMALARCNSLLW